MNRVDKNNAGNWIYLPENYLAFLPKELPISNLILNNEILAQLKKTKEELTKFNSRDFLDKFNEKSIDIFLKFFLMKEAIFSSKIEGIDGLEEEFLKVARINSKTNFFGNDIFNNYVALEYAYNLTKNLPISKRFFKNVHTILLKNPDKIFFTPGEFRISQNWIGKEGSSLKDALFVPPPPNEIDRLLSNLENYINNDNIEEPLIKAAIIHSQFETIHPFLDGNGRIGRIINSIFLNNNKICDSRFFIFSNTIFKNLNEYYKNLQTVHDFGDWNSWILFYLKMVEEAAKNSENMLFYLVNSYSLNEMKINAHIEESSLFLASQLLINFVSNISLDFSDFTLNNQQLKYLLSKFQEYGIITKVDKNIYIYNDIFNSLYEE